MVIELIISLTVPPPPKLLSLLVCNKTVNIKKIRINNYDICSHFIKESMPEVKKIN